MSFERNSESVRRTISELMTGETVILPTDGPYESGDFGTDADKIELGRVRTDEASQVVADEKRSKPMSIDELTHRVVQTYDLSTKVASGLSMLPSLEVSLTGDVRVVVCEHSAYRLEQSSERQDLVGYAIRLLLTVSRLQGVSKLSLPVLAASAELGQIEAMWQLQVIGLAGKRIDSLIAPPRELNVESFVIARQSLEALVGAIHDSSTVFSPQVIGSRTLTGGEEGSHSRAIGHTLALLALAEGVSLERLAARLMSGQSAMHDGARYAYALLGLGASDSPSDSQRVRAEEMLRGVPIRRTYFWGL